MTMTVVVMMMGTLERMGVNWHDTRPIVWVPTCTDTTQGR
jgi:hypothetical protein